MGFLNRLFDKAEKKEDIKEKKKKEFSYENEIIGNKVIVYVIPDKIYQEELSSIIKATAKRFSRIWYLCINKPAERVKEVFKEDGIDTGKILFIDAITKSVKENVSYDGIIYISPPDNLDKFIAELNQILEKEKVECLIFDSLSTMLLYQDDSTVISFTHELIAKLIVMHACGEFICLAKADYLSIVKDVGMFADKVINVGGEENTAMPEDYERREMILKLENQLISVRQAYATGFLSENSYLKTKNRIENKIKQLKN